MHRKCIRFILYLLKVAKWWFGFETVQGRLSATTQITQVVDEWRVVKIMTKMNWSFQSPDIKKTSEKSWRLCSIESISSIWRNFFGIYEKLFGFLFKIKVENSQKECFVGRLKRQ